MFTITIEDQNGQVADTFSFDHGSYTVGRLDGCDVVLPSTSVSREHARIFIEEGRCYIEDLGSANGVIVDGQRVVTTRDLGTASQICIGDFYLYLEYEAPADAQRQDVLSTLFIDSGSEHHKLVRINDSFAGEEFSLSEQQNTIGRTDDNFILLSDSSISRRHASIHRRGELYAVEDLGSSNGTRVNGKDVVGRQELNSGDHVEFGSVEFVFVEGDKVVDPEEVAARFASNNTAVYAGLAALAVVALLAGGLVIFGIAQLTGGSDDGVTEEPEQRLEAEVNDLLQNGRNQLRMGNWEAATTTFDEALALSPGHEEAQELLGRVEYEREASEILAEGEALSQEGRHSEAREKLLTIPEDTLASDRAEPTLAHLNRTISHSLMSSANRLYRRGEGDELREAHEMAAQAYVVEPGDGVAELLDDIEARLDEEGIDFEPAPR